MWKWMLIALVGLYASGCEKLSKNIDRGQASADNSQEIKRIDRELSAEQEHSRQQETTVVEDVRAIQQWQNKVKESAAKDVAFNEAVDKQFAPLHRCLNNMQDAGCVVLEDIKTCLKTGGPMPNSSLCQAITTLYNQNDSQEKRLQTVVDCLATADAFTLDSARTPEWKKSLSECKTLHLIVKTAVELTKKLEEKMTESITQLGNRIAVLEKAEENRREFMNQLTAQMKAFYTQQVEIDKIIKKSERDSIALFEVIRARSELLQPLDNETLVTCFFNHVPDNGDVSTCRPKF